MYKRQERDCADDEDLSAEWEMVNQKAIALDDRNAKLREQFGVRSDKLRIHCVPEDIFSGSELGSGDLVFGLGVLGFPTTDQNLLEDLITLSNQGADWHSWVT